MTLKLLSIVIFSILFVVSASAQGDAFIVDKLHAVSLEGNLIGDSLKRKALVYLPQNYETQKKRRYPVVYFLQGYGVNDSFSMKNTKNRFTEIMNQLIAKGKINPMILVIVNGGNKFGGSYYTNSIATGNWEDFIVRDLVGYIDKKYRTIPKVESRGIAGHSMGGYGAIKLGMKHPDIFGAVYSSSSCCLDIFPGKNPNNKNLQAASEIKSWEEAIKIKDFGIKVALAYASAFSPNPDKAPFFADFPFSNSGDLDTVAENAKARWISNNPTFMADQFRTNLLALRGIAFDVGAEEGPLLTANRVFSETLNRNKVEHLFEIFEGGHNDKLAERLEMKIMPFFSQMLVFQTTRNSR